MDTPFQACSRISRRWLILGSSSTSNDNEMITKMNEKIRSDCRLTVREIADELRLTAHAR